MRWDGKMKILRLSLFNLKKNKKEAIVVAFLTLITTMLLAMVVINSSKISKTFDDSLREIGAENGILVIKKDVYRNANVSHELRTPITTIGGFVDGILDGTIPKTRQNEYLVLVSKEIKRLRILISSMLNMSRFETVKK